MAALAIIGFAKLRRRNPNFAKRITVSAFISIATLATAAAQIGIFQIAQIALSTTEGGGDNSRALATYVFLSPRASLCAALTIVFLRYINGVFRSLMLAGITSRTTLLPQHHIAPHSSTHRWILHQTAPRQHHDSKNTSIHSQVSG
jgi:hypothetical protein